MLGSVLAGAVIAVPLAGADGGHDDEKPKAFNHIGTFNVPANLPAGEAEDTVTSAEIVAATPDGKKLVYTDSPAGRLGFIDINQPWAPAAGGAIDVGGEPTSVATYQRWALVAVNTRESFDNPSGKLLVVNIATKQIVKSIELGGQPDSIDLSPDQRYAAIVIENERDEDENDGFIPQLPSGNLKVLDLRTLFDAVPKLKTVALTGLSTTAPTDAEPEYVDINSHNLAVVSLQENNHLAIVDLAKAAVIRHFSAGTVTLPKVDATEDDQGPQGNGVISLKDTITNRRREPDSVAWIDSDTFATANEGDYVDPNDEEGGSRGFTLFSKYGKVEYESGASFEYEIVRAGHYPEARSENKGNEPEGLEVGTFGKRKLLFVGSERANAVGVYELGGKKPEFRQLLPTGIGPEGIEAIPGRDLLAVSAETDGAADGLRIRSLVTLYKLSEGQVYPYVKSGDEAYGLPIPWVALSGLSGDPKSSSTVWAASDSILAQAFIYRVDVSRHPAKIVKRIPVGGVDVADQTKGDFDIEGIFARPEGGFWLASEGRINVGSSRPNLLVRTDANGAVLESIPLPPGLVAEATSSGFEGVTATGSKARGDETVWAVIQREWDDEDGFVKIARYDVAAKKWTFALYPLDAPESPSGGVVGLSEITLLPHGKRVAIVERDDRIALDARIKRIYGVDLADRSVQWKEFGNTLDVVKKRLLRDVLGDLDRRSISVPDKLEGVAVTKDDRVFLATDNDGVDENYGETLFFSPGSVWRAFDW